MNIRKTVPLLTIIAFGGVSPALADCCSSIWDCAAAVVSDGLSCEIETIISTIKSLVTLTNNMLSDIDGQTQAAETSARQSVTDAYNSMQSQSQQAAADLTQAKTQADLIYHEETAIRSLQSTTVSAAAGMQESASAQSGAPLRGVTQQRKAGTSPPQGNSSPENLRQKSIVVAAASGAAVSIAPKAPHGEYADAFSRGLKLITTLSLTGNGDLSQVNHYLAAALASEGPGVAAADTLAGVMRAPLNDIESELSSMLTNPLSAFDPSNAVDSIENSITANMSGNISKMIDDISTGPTQAFNAAGPPFDDLLANAENAQAVAVAMDRLYKERTPGAANALYALLPQQQYANLSAKATASGRLAAGFGQRVSFAKVKTNLAASRQKILLSVRPLNVAPIHAAVAQFKAQRAQGKSAQAPSMLAMYRSNTTRRLDEYFAGKSPLAMATERDQLIAQARTKFANDPKTENGVIGLIDTEARKHGVAMSAALPGQHVPPLTGAGAAATRMPSAVPVTAPTATAMISAPAPTQRKVASWGTTPAWSPPTPATAPTAAIVTSAAPAAPHVVAVTKPAIAPKIVQPVQGPAQQPAAAQSAPSSMKSNP